MKYMIVQVYRPDTNNNTIESLEPCFIVKQDGYRSLVDAVQARDRDYKDSEVFIVIPYA